MRTLIIGLGNMGSALALGIQKDKDKHDIQLSALLRENSNKETITSQLEIEVFYDPIKAIKEAEAILICVKPQGLQHLSETLKDHISEKNLVISILAGTSIEDLSKALNFKGAIIRAMPNIAATVGCASTVLSKNDKCSQAHENLVKSIFCSVGVCHFTEESLIDAATGLSGSGPAYICMVIESLTDGGVKMGLSRPLALDLSIQTVLGSAKLARETGLHPAVLRDRVTTPGGTTIHAIHELEAHGLRSMLISAVVTATEQSKKLRSK
ncbi:MAG: pyrroline-5-carboxylate reductase [Oligoflexales bacterium]